MRTRRRLKKIEDIRRLLADSLNKFIGQELSVDEMRCLSYSCNVLSGIITQSDLEDRLEKLEKTLENSK